MFTVKCMHYTAEPAQQATPSMALTSAGWHSQSGAVSVTKASSHPIGDLTKSKESKGLVTQDFSKGELKKVGIRLRITAAQVALECLRAFQASLHQ